jgi:hypothetical protein
MSENDKNNNDLPPVTISWVTQHRRARSESARPSLRNQAGLQVRSSVDERLPSRLEKDRLEKLSPANSRGPTWESYSEVKPDKLNMLLPKPVLKQTGILQGGEFAPAPSPSPRHGGSIPTLGRKIAGISLGYSRVIPLIVRSPTTAAGKFSDGSPVPSRPHDTQLRSVSTATPQQSPSLDHYAWSKSISAFEYALRPHFKKLEDYNHTDRFRSLPLTKHDNESEGTASLQDDEDLFGFDEQKETEPPEYGIPVHILEMDPTDAGLRSMRVRTLLMRCTVLQTIIREFQRKPWVHAKGRTPREYYEEIRKLAYEARELAESLESRDLQARCAYWAGRACGGTRDYEAAEGHFKNALQLDVKNDWYRSGRIRLRGLRPMEKADVAFLEKSCSERHINYLKHLQSNLAWAKQCAEATGNPIEVFIEETTPQSPPWVPDRDRVIVMARRRFDTETRSGMDGNFVDQQLGEEPKVGLQAQWQSEEDDLRDIYRRTLSKDEWKYIKHGDYKAAQARIRQQSADQSANDISLLRTPSPRPHTAIPMSPSSELSSLSAPFETVTQTRAREQGSLEFDSPPLSSSSSPTSSRVSQCTSEPVMPIRTTRLTLKTVGVAEQFSPRRSLPFEVDIAKPAEPGQRRG